MKTCAACNESFHDDSLNFCLNCGATLPQPKDNPPPTILMNTARETNPNYANQTDYANQPNFSNQPNFGAGAPLQNWQNPPQMQNQQFGTPAPVFGVNQTLPTISLVMGILGLLLFCCWGGLPLGLAAAITGYLGMNNVNKDPQRYGGKGLAIAGLILGGINIVGSIILILLAILGNLAN